MKKDMMKAGGSSLALACLLGNPAQAQRVDNNAVAAAEDAFGVSVGDEKIGLYNADDVRGFSPISAGNVRVEGLYFDQQAHVTDRILAGSTVRVGLSAQGYPFPAPTGIADYSLRKAGAKRVISIGLSHGPFDGNVAELDVEVPLDGERLGLIAGAGLYREGSQNGSKSALESYGISLRYAPSASFSIQPFYSQIDIRDEEATPLIFMRDAVLPTRIKRNTFLGQNWAEFEGRIRNYGVVTKGKLLGFDVGLGVFRSQLSVAKDHTDLLIDTDTSGASAGRLIFADRDNFFASTSGEFRLSRSFDERQRRHLVHGTVRMRSLDRRYGGTDVIDLGPSRIDAPDYRAERPVTIGPKTRDHVSQKTYGLGYELRWAKLGELGLSVQKSDYAKRVTEVGGRIGRSEDAPWLYSATLALRLGSDVVAYGGFVRGLEESDAAPNEADNRNEAPPAIRTRQHDFGARWAIRKGLSAVLGYFDIRKPYYNLDNSRRFRNLGEVRKRGVEFSLSGKLTPSLTMVLGGLYNDATISGEEVGAGVIGRRASGTSRYRANASLNWAVPWHEPLTVTARVFYFSDWIANPQNTLKVPGRTILSGGARYRFSLGKTQLLARVNVDNILNTFGWNASSSGYFTNNPSRRLSLSLAADL